MRLLKEKSREYKGNTYFKYKINLPSGAIDRAKFKEGDDIYVNAQVGKIELSKEEPKPEFSDIRSRLYKKALREFPDARAEDIVVMKKYLAPKKGERILEIGAGSGYFSKHIASMVGDKGRLIVSDPSLEQLEEIKELNIKNIEVIQYVQFGSEKVNLEKDKIDGVWAFGSMHHIFQKSKSFENMNRILRKGGRIVIADVFSGSKLAKHFDDRVAKYCVVGHEVAFWSREYAETLCFVNGFTKPKFYDLNQKWRFKNKEDAGIFLYKLHAMTKATPKECLKGAEEILGIRRKGKFYELNWPLTLFITKKIK